MDLKYFSAYVTRYGSQAESVQKKDRQRAIKASVLNQDEHRQDNQDLFFAVIHKNYDEVRRCLKRGAEPDFEMGRAIKVTIKNNDSQMLNLLLSQSTSTPSIDFRHYELFQLACDLGYQEIASQLYEHDPLALTELKTDHIKDPNTLDWIQSLHGRSISKTIPHNLTIDLEDTVDIPKVFKP